MCLPTVAALAGCKMLLYGRCVHKLLMMAHCHSSVSVISGLFVKAMQPSNPACCRC